MHRDRRSTQSAKEVHFCNIKMTNGKIVRVRTDDLMEKVKSIIADNEFYGYKKGYSEPEIEAYRVKAKEYKKKLRLLLSSGDDQTLCIDKMTDIPIIPGFSWEYDVVD